MRAYALLFPLMVVTAASPAAAQVARTYACTVDGSSNEVWYKFGTGELRIFDRDAWSENWCGSATVCKFDGPQFTGGGEEDDFDFIYNATTGRYSRSDLGGRYAGTCRPE
jgi:hypothetical protein